MKSPSEILLTPERNAPKIRQSEMIITENTVNGHWGYKTTTPNQSGRRLEKKNQMHYSQRINQIAKSKLNEMLEIEKEMSLVEAKSGTTQKRVQSAS